MTTTFWNLHAGRELDATPLTDDILRPTRIVACLNVWNDLNALRQTIGSWSTYVDHIVVVDGAYDIDRGLSTDGTREFLREFPSVEVIDAAGLSQCEKRTRYLSIGRPGDYLFIIDADESVADAGHLRALPACDIGWVRVQSSLYTREYGQPRIIRWRPDLYYRGRHHWMYCGERLFCTHQYGGPGYIHRPVPIILNNQRHLGRSRERQQAKRSQHVQQYMEERILSATPRSIMSDASVNAREALQILNIAYRDDGLAPSRLHTAINRTTPHSSLFFKSRPGPFGVPEQYSTRIHGVKLEQALRTADVLHYHGVMSMAQRSARAIPTVFHHHGSMLRANHGEYNTQARDRGALVLVSNLELLSWTDEIDARFLPNTVPAERYATLAQMVRVPFTGSNTFRVAHSPSQPHRKGTDQFLAACQRLVARGVPIEPVMIHDVTHAQALALKATCHASFDSFWLGIQCSGVEAAAMEMPVIAGDDTVAARYVEHFGACPYTFANNGEELEQKLFDLINDSDYYAVECDRVHTYVIENHDESAVALTYLDYLDAAFGWRSQELKRLPTTSSRSVFRGARI
jgi:hypothetical protein